MSQKIPTPFTCTHSPNLPELLQKLNITLALSTYQAGKVIFISATNNESLIQLPRNFNKAMGMAVKDRKMAIALKDEILVLANSPELAETYPPKPNTYDAIFLPRATYYTGQVDIHDLEWVGDDLLAVNTRFSCLAKIDTDFSFKPVWKPYFISGLSPDDRCHLNGLCSKDSKPAYVTALGKTDVPEGWRPGKANGGIIMDVTKNEIIIDELAMPHSPRIYNGELYCLLSAKGQLIKVDPQKGSYELMQQFEGYVRGMAKAGDYLFIGLSKLRKKSSSFGDLPIADKSITCGIEVIHFPTMSKVARLKYESSVEELYDVKIMHGMRRPNVLNTLKDDHRKALVIPGGITYWAKDN